MCPSSLLYPCCYFVSALYRINWRFTVYNVKSCIYQCFSNSFFVFPYFIVYSTKILFNNFNYFIYSKHYLDCLGGNNYWSIDGPFDEFENGLNTLFDGDIEAGTRRFFEFSGLMIEKGGFDVVGHVDKITYHGRKYSGFDITKPGYKKLMIKLLEQIKAQHMILEINTKSLADHGITYPHQTFYETIARMEIPLMVNSDCHYPTNITAGFDETYKALHKAGVRHSIS